MKRTKEKRKTIHQKKKKNRINKIKKKDRQTDRLIDRKTNEQTSLISKTSMSSNCNPACLTAMGIA